MIKWLAKVIEDYTNKRYAGKVTIIFNLNADKVLSARWVNSKYTKSFFRSGTAFSCASFRKDANIPTMRGHQDITAQEIGWKALLLPLGDLYIALLADKEAEVYGIRIRDAAGVERDIPIQNGKVKVVFESNNVLEATIDYILMEK